MPPAAEAGDRGHAPDVPGLLHPAFVALLGLVGLARWAGYPDYGLFPLLGLFLVLLGYGAWQRQQGGRGGGRSKEEDAWRSG